MKKTLDLIKSEIEFLISVHGDGGRAIKKLREIRASILEESGLNNKPSKKSFRLNEYPCIECCGTCEGHINQSGGE